MGKQLFIILLFGIHVLGYSQTNIEFTSINKNQGLSDNNVNCIYKDSEGFVWFGTRNGLCRYDGYEIKVYRNNKSENSISNNRILDICEDNAGYLWIGTTKGLNRYNKETDSFKRLTGKSQLTERIDRIKVFSDSSIWVCSAHGLVHIIQSTNSIEVFTHNPEDQKSLSNNFVYDILETSKGEIYVAGESMGLQRYNPQEKSFDYIYYHRYNELSGNYKKQLIEDENGLIWISAHYHGLCSYNPKSGESNVYTKEGGHLSTNDLMGSMTLDNNNKLWLCTEEEGINIFDIKSKSYVHLKHDKQNKNSLATNQTYSVYIDSDNVVWVGTFDKGVNRYNPQKNKFSNSLFASNDLEILKGQSVLDIFEDSKQNVWVGTDGNGLYKFSKGKETTHYFKKEKNKQHWLSSNIITALGEDYLGNILIGTYSGGLISHNPEQNTGQTYLPEYLNQKALSSTHVWEITDDNEKRVFLGLLSSGYDLYNPESKEFKHFGPGSNTLQTIDFPNVMVILHDTDGDMWFGTEGRGVFILDRETNKMRQMPDTAETSFLTTGLIKSFVQDKWGYIWIGTENQGLFKLDKRQGIIDSFNEDNGLPPGPIQSLQEDAHGNIVIGTAWGLYLLNPKLKHFTHFVAQDGLSGNDFNADAMTKISDGRILAGTHSGADLISIGNIKLNQTLPRIVFTKLLVLNEEINPNDLFNSRIILNKGIDKTEKLVLNWKEKVFTIEFAALNTTLPLKCEYKYMLEGFDDDWVKTTALHRTANYSNLDPGKYIFKVIASNNDGKWGDNQRELQILIKPPWWNTLALKIIYLLFLSYIIFWFYRRKLDKINKRHEEFQAEQEKKLILLEKEKLEAESKKLAFSIVSKNRLLIDQKNKINLLSNKAKPSVKEGLQKVVDNINEELDEEKDWKFIEPQIDKAYNQFITKLKAKHPDLTATEIRIAAYIRMNLSTKEISEILNKTTRAIENDRYRLRKKINLETNDSIQGYLLRI